MHVLETPLVERIIAFLYKINVRMGNRLTYSLTIDQTYTLLVTWCELSYYVIILPYFNRGK